MTDDPFLSWLYKQERSISREEINDKWPRAQFKKMIGITATFGEYKGEEVSLIKSKENTCGFSRRMNPTIHYTNPRSMAVLSF